MENTMKNLLEKAKELLKDEKKRMYVLIGALALVILIIGIVVMSCGKEEKQVVNNTQKLETQTQETQVTEEPEIIPPETNLLTGLPTLTEEAVGKRPVAIMINNIRQSLPQYGVAQADVIFEIPVEGGLSRFMALYGDYTQVPKVCSVRSCRKYFADLSEGFDAVYVCSGMAPDAQSHVESLGVTLLEYSKNASSMFGRDENRLAQGLALEHTMYFDGTKIVDKMADLEMRTDLEEGMTGTAFHFVKDGETYIPTGDECDYVKANFGGMTATLKYDETSNTYLKENGGNAQVDGVTGEQLAFTNVFILETTVGDDPNGTHKTIDWVGGDTSVGYYISNGAVQKIHYRKDSVESRLQFFDEDGNELAINRGKTYIAFVNHGKVEFE